MIMGSFDRMGLVGNLVGCLGRVGGGPVSACSEVVWHGLPVFRKGEGDAGRSGVGEELVRGAGKFSRQRGVRQGDAGGGEELACQGGGVADGPGVDAEQGAGGLDGQVEVVAEAEREEVAGDVEPPVAVRVAAAGGAGAAAVPGPVLQLE